MEDRFCVCVCFFFRARILTWEVARDFYESRCEIGGSWWKPVEEDLSRGKKVINAICSHRKRRKTVLMQKKKKKKTLRAKNGHFVQLSVPSRQYGENLVENRSLSIWEYLSAFRAFHQYREDTYHQRSRGDICPWNQRIIMGHNFVLFETWL